MNAFRDPLEVERLLTQNSLRRSLAADNRVTVDFQDKWQRLISRPCDRFDEIDEAAADPCLDRLPAYRKGSEADRLTSLLDSLERGDG